MGKLHEWISSQLSKPKSNPLWKLFLTGVKGQLESKNPKPYNFYIKILNVSATILLAYYFLSFRKNEMDVQGHNMLIPSYVYKVREENYIYWETVRVAKGMPTFLTYYKWDENLMFEIDRKGNQTPLLTHKSIETSETFQSPLHEYNFPATPETHSRIVLYLKNINNPYDLQNYLRIKPINIGDWLRTGYYFVYRELGLSNRWRYDEYVRKSDVFYRWEKIKLAFYLSRDRDLLYDVIDLLRERWGSEEIKKFFVWFL